MIKRNIIKLLFRLLGLDNSLREVYEASDLPTMETPKEDKVALKLMIDKHKVALADVADVDEYMKYLKQLILMYQRLRLRNNKKDYLIIILFLTKHIYELEQSLRRYHKMDRKFILKVRKEKLKNQIANN